MPVTALSDNKQSVKVLLMSGIQHAFLIPEYQRPYAWTPNQQVALSVKQRTSLVALCPSSTKRASRK